MKNCGKRFPRGTYRDNRKGCPQTTVNALLKKKKKEKRLHQVDTREVSVCFTINAAFDGATVKRRIKLGGQLEHNIDAICFTPILQ